MIPKNVIYIKYIEIYEILNENVILLKKVLLYWNYTNLRNAF